MLSVVMITQPSMEAYASYDALSSSSSLSSNTPSETGNVDSVSLNDLLAEEPDSSITVREDKTDPVQAAILSEEMQEQFEAQDEDPLHHITDEESGNEAAEIEMIPLTRELTYGSSENSLLYERADHSVRAFYYAEPVNYQEKDGEWRKIDNRLSFKNGEENTDSEKLFFDGYVNHNAPFHVCFAEEADENRLLTIESDDHSVLLTYVPDESAQQIIADSETEQKNTKDSTLDSLDKKRQEWELMMQN